MEDINSWKLSISNGNQFMENINSWRKSIHGDIYSSRKSIHGEGQFIEEIILIIFLSIHTAYQEMLHMITIPI